MASIGLLAAGVAHEVNTPLTGISSFTQMLLEGADPEDPRTRLLEKIERQTFRAAKIVNGLLTLSRPGVGVDRSLDRPQRRHRRRARAARAPVRDAPHQRAARAERDAGHGARRMEHKLQQVFLNLFLNAQGRDAEGRLAVGAAPGSDGGRVVAEVADTGSGIPNEYLARIYDPFFTTKAIGQGTGLGLSITYGIVREHDGAIDCDSVIGQGTRFILSFPAMQAERAAFAIHGA